MNEDAVDYAMRFLFGLPLLVATQKEIIAKLAVGALTADEPLPKHEREELSKLLENPPKPRRGRAANRMRNLMLAVVVFDVSVRFKLKPTRNRAAKVSASAASVVAEACCYLGLNLSEDAVNKVWNTRECDHFHFEDGMVGAKCRKPLTAVYSERDTIVVARRIYPSETNSPFVVDDC